MKIDHRHTYGIMIDTETCNDLARPICYDISWQVIDSKGKLYESRSFAVHEVFADMPDALRTCYYAQKIPSYYANIAKHNKELIPLAEILLKLDEDIVNYDCAFICAHNARFDYRALKITQEEFSPADDLFNVDLLEWWDTLKMANDTICRMPTFIKFCRDNGYLTKKNQVRKTAEVLYRFIVRDTEFVEEHEALADVDIERQILAYCVRQHKKMRKTLTNN